MGKTLKDVEEYDEAIPYLENAVWILEHKLEALVELGNCFLSLKKMDKAIPVLEQAVNTIKDEAELYSLYARYFLAMCFEKTGEFAKAVLHWDMIYAINENFRDVREKLGLYIEYRQQSENGLLAPG
jgi:tetratricopeptide (TPR) repeat protein